VTATTVIDFDVWRARYDDMTFAEHQDFNAAIAEQYPEQQSWDRKACRRFIEERHLIDIVEVGGWDGGLAKRMLNLKEEY